MSIPSLVKKCAVCGVKKSKEQKLLKCGRCYSVRYCTAAHQREHWSIHKKICKAVVENAEDIKWTAHMNEGFDMAYDFMEDDLIDGFKAILDNHEQELVNWASKEYNDSILLHVACYHNKTSFVKVLLDRGSHINATTGDGYSPLMISAMQGHASCISLLLSRGADVHIRGAETVSAAIALAAQNGHISCLSQLIDAGADVNVRNQNGYTSLMFASQNNHINCVTMLLDRGADINLMDLEGWYAVLIASRKGHQSIISLLLNRGAPLETRKNNAGGTPLMYTAHNGHASCLSMLLDRGANIDAVGEDLGATSLMLATLGCHRSCVSTLLDRGADTSVVDNFGATVLGLASDPTIFKMIADRLE